MALYFPAIADGYVRLVQGITSNTTIIQIDRDGSAGSAIFRPSSNWIMLPKLK
ncbi:MAG: hypothetical protein HC908_15705 [Calothrix sp. SM1_7_51]|nr:hypothetical protein [Calothrix sp. SM1_7_51]